MKQDEIIHYLELLGKHGEYGKALKEWLGAEEEKRHDITRVSSWDETLKAQAVIDFIRRELAMLEEKSNKPTEKNNYL